LRTGDVIVRWPRICGVAAVVFRFEGDRIVEEWVNRDELSILLQLDVVSTPAGIGTIEGPT
jgi:hypothetical protein